MVKSIKCILKGTRIDGGGKSAVVVDRYGNPAGLENLHLGGHVFLVLGGPSLNELDLECLYTRGVVTFSLNNVCAWLRTNYWTYGDTSAKFHDAIWRDPGVVKFCPQPKLGNVLMEKLPDGEFRELEDRPRDMPGVFGIKRNSQFDPETWLWEDTINWGNGKKGVQRKGNVWPKVLSTMPQAVRLCYYLGFRTVYLLGCDFGMSSNFRYAFPESRKSGAVSGNNNAYVSLAKLFGALRPVFDEAGFTLLNCNNRSNLTVFDYLSYEAALDAATAAMPKHIDTVGWYEYHARRKAEAQKQQQKEDSESSAAA